MTTILTYALQSIGKDRCHWPFATVWLFRSAPPAGGHWRNCCEPSPSSSKVNYANWYVQGWNCRHFFIHSYRR